MGDILTPENAIKFEALTEVQKDKIQVDFDIFLILFQFFLVFNI